MAALDDKDEPPGPTLPPTLPPAEGPSYAPSPSPASPPPASPLPTVPHQPRTPRAASGRNAAEGAVGGAYPVVDWDRYEFFGLLGRGGMGEVYEARDRRLGRRVALKFLRGAYPELALRLLQEARAQARVEHPNVCKVYEAGEVAGRAYIAMQLVRGRPLNEAAAEMSLREKVKVLAQVAEAVHEAHRLGVVHRDLKPSNVLVGPGAGGRLSPMVMDFGLAYQISHGHGLTSTGTLMGTPSYMAPEQARGEVQNVDRRSDVYSLGATLYELLAGAPPFGARTAIATLHKVLHEEPPALRSLAPEVPPDLETVVLKCLSKEPERRYGSARALAEDLGRFLDGEPILGRRLGLLGRLARWARRRPAASALAAVSLALLAFGALSRLEARRARAESSERARLAQELGRRAEEIEWLLRAAYAMPLHDTTREERRVRERMAEIAEKGGPGEGLVHHALGRGRLALGEFDEARRELELARRLGASSPELDLALGRALGELYRRSLDDARRAGGAAWAEARRAEIEARFLAPALAALERARPAAATTLESAQFLEGLIALYRGDHEKAASAAERAEAESPWAYEARKLAGDAALGRAQARLERGDYGAAREGFDEATALYGRAAEVGRSDARAQGALAEAWLGRAEVGRRQGDTHGREEALEKAIEAAQRAVEAAPLRAVGHAGRAQILMNRYLFSRPSGDSERLTEALREWVSAASRAVELDPHDAYALDALGNAYAEQALRDAREGRDPNPAFGRAADALARAIELEPAYPWGLNDLALVYRSLGGYERETGRDPSASYAEAERYFLRAAESDPAYLFAHSNLSELYVEEASLLLGRGLDPGPEVDKASDAGRKALSLDVNYAPALGQIALAELARAQYFVESGGDPRPHLARAFAELTRARTGNPTHGRTHLYLAQGHHLFALYALREGGEPGAAIEAGRRSLAEALRHDADCVDCLVESARLALTDASWARRQGRPTLPALRRAIAEARSAVAAYPYVDAHRELANACLRLAEALPREGAFAAIAEGEGQIERALRLDPRGARAHAVRGGLSLARARLEREAGARIEALRGAGASFDRAVEINPLLRGECEEARQEIARLLAAAGRGP